MVGGQLIQNSLIKLHDTITIQSTKKGVNPFELTPYYIWWS